MVSVPFTLSLGPNLLELRSITFSKLLGGIRSYPAPSEPLQKNLSYQLANNLSPLSGRLEQVTI